MKTRFLHFLCVGLLTALLTINATAQRRLPLPVNPDGVGIRSGEAPLYSLPPFSGSTVGANDRFGEAVASTEDLLVVGAPGENSGGQNESGAVYIFQPDGVGGWEELARIQQTVPIDAANFGSSVAIYGTGIASWILVGAPGTLHDPTPGVPGDENTGAGKIYLFKPDITPGTWMQAGSLISPQVATNGKFGAVVDIWNNGSPEPSMLIGAPGEQGFSVNSGAVYLYQFDAGAPGTFNRFAAPDDQTGSQFGFAIARLDSSIQPTFFVSAPGFDRTAPSIPNAGKVYTFYNFSSYTTGPEIVSPNGENGGFFGKSLSAQYMGGDITYLTIGAPVENFSGQTDAGRAYVVTIDTSIVTPTVANIEPIFAGDPAPQRKFGSSVDISLTEGQPRILVGSPTSDGTNPGRAYLFDNSSGTWEQQEVLDGTESTSDFFGASVSLKEMDGKTHAFIGASRGDPEAGAPLTTGAAYIFLRPDPAIIVETVSPAPHEIHEDGTVSFEYNLYLATPPTADVTITATMTGDCVFRDPVRDDTEIVMFSNLNWNMPYQIIVDALPDDIAKVSETCDITHSVSSIDPDYASQTPGGFNLPIIDDDTAGVDVILSDINHPYEISEDGSLVINLEMDLSSEPEGQVVVMLSFTGDDCLLVDTGARDSDYSFTFAPPNWDTPQNVDIEAFDDADIEGTHTCTLDMMVDNDTTTDSTYDSVTIPSISFTVLDNDSAGGVELARNASMEDPVPNKPEKPQFWVFKNFAGKDTRFCPGSGSPFVVSGNCSVQFGGNETGPRAVLRSTRSKVDMVDNLGLALSTDDAVRVHFQYRLSNNKADPLMRLVAFRNFGGDRTVLARIELPHPGDSNYDQWLTFDQTFDLTTTDFKQLRLIFKDFSKQGKWWVDDVSFQFMDGGGSGGGGARLPLP